MGTTKYDSFYIIVHILSEMLLKVSIQLISVDAPLLYKLHQPCTGHRHDFCLILISG